MTAKEISNRSPIPTKREGERLRCPNCSCTSWYIGRTTATCANERRCGFVVELAQAVDYDFGGDGQ